MPHENFSSINNPRCAGRPRGHGLSYYLMRELEKKLPEGINKKEAMAKRLVEIGLDPGTSDAVFISIYELMSDRLEGKAINMNLNADLMSNPFEGIPTEKIEALREKLNAVNTGK